MMNTSTEPSKKRPGCLRLLLWAIPAAITLVFLFYAIENWRGARAWQAIEDEIKELRKTFAPDTELGQRRTEIADAPSPVVIPLTYSGSLIIP